MSEFPAPNDPPRSPITPEAVPVPETPGGGELKITILQPELIFEQVRRLRKSEPSGVVRPLVGNGAPTSKNDQLRDVSARVFAGKSIGGGQVEEDAPVFDFGIDEDCPNPINTNEGLSICDSLKEETGCDIQLSRGTQGKYAEHQQYLTIKDKDYVVSISLGSIGTQEARRFWESRFGELYDLNRSQGKSDEIALEEARDAYRTFLDNPLAYNSISVFVGHARGDYNNRIPLNDSKTFNQALQIGAVWAERVYRMINRTRGVNPLSRELIIKPLAMGVGDERVASEIAKINAPVPEDLAMPEEDTTFEDIVGYEEEKENLKDIAWMLGGGDKKAPKGMLLYGPPGTGKTTVAKAFATECRDFATFTPLEMGGVFTSYIHESANKLKGFLEEAQKKTYEQKKESGHRVFG